LHALKILDKTGHTVMDYRPDAPTAEPGQFTTEQVRARFDQLVKQEKWLAIATTPDGGAEVIREFDETRPEIILQPQLVGG
jgi:hypothetical protein